MSDLISALYIVAFAMFIIGLHMLRGPRTAVRGNQAAAVGMAIAVFATLLSRAIGEVSGWFNDLILVIAIAFGTINVVGGFLVTDRMLEMFKKRPTPGSRDAAAQDGAGKPEDSA